MPAETSWGNPAKGERHQEGSAKQVGGAAILWGRNGSIWGGSSEGMMDDYSATGGVSDGLMGLPIWEVVAVWIQSRAMRPLEPATNRRGHLERGGRTERKEGGEERER